MTDNQTFQGETNVRFSLVSLRPLPESLLAHTRARIGELTSFTETTPKSPDLYTRTFTFALDDPEHLRAELRTPAMALGVDSAYLTGPIAANGPDLIVTDVDSTFITTEVIEMLAAYAGVEEEVRAVTTAAMQGKLDFSQSLKERVAKLAGVPESVFTDVFDAVELTPGAQHVIDTIHSNGGHFGLVSGGFNEVVGPLAQRSGVDVFVANGLEVADGKLTGKTYGPVIDSAAKVRAVQQWATEFSTTPARTLCAGDGANDLGMMGIAGLGVAFQGKPIVIEQADCSINFPRLDALCAFVGWDVNE